jgi:hypothetical protein
VTILKEHVDEPIEAGMCKVRGCTFREHGDSPHSFETFEGDDGPPSVRLRSRVFDDARAENREGQIRVEENSPNLQTMNSGALRGGPTRDAARARAEGQIPNGPIAGYGRGRVRYDGLDEDNENLENEDDFVGGYLALDEFNEHVLNGHDLELWHSTFPIESFCADAEALHVTCFYINGADSIPIPNTYEEAMASPWSAKWKEAMDKEIAGLMKYGTWDEKPASELPNGANLVKSKWVYTVKYHRDGTVERFKARFVCCGYSQKKGIDYDRSFSATLKASSFRLLLALAARKKLQLEHCDISNAFVQASIGDVEIFAAGAKGYSDGKILRLRNALYGTKQASRMFQLELRKKLMQFGFTPCVSDPCIFTFDCDAGRMIVGCYVDDLIVAHSSSELFCKFMDSVLNPLRGGFDGKHVGKLDWFLGVGIDVTDSFVQMSQKKYINDLVHKFACNDQSFIAYSTPCTVEQIAKLGNARDDIERNRVKDLPYLQLVGSLLYIATMTRPDISFVMSHLCQYMQDPNAECYKIALNVLMYLNKTQSLCIRFDSEPSQLAGLESEKSNIDKNMGFVCFSDASWGGKAPAYGYCCFMSNGPISFAAKKMKAAESSCEAEYSAAYQACKEIAFLRSLLDELNVSLNGCAILGVDNSAAIDIANDYGVSARTKHFERVLHFVRESVADLRVRLVFVRTVNQLADLFTKPLGKTDFIRLRNAFLVDEKM